MLNTLGEICEGILMVFGTVGFCVLLGAGLYWIIWDKE
jgi:hypothetical protein